MKRLLGWFGVSVLGAIACAPGLAIEDDAEGTGGSKPGSGGRSSGGTSGQTGGTGGTSLGGDSNPDGGSNTGGRPAGGSSGSGSSSGSGGGTASGGASSTVEGRIIDLYGRPLLNIEVRVGEDERDITDAQGRFSIEGVPSKYDAEFRISARSEVYQRIYRFIGLTRRDPTLQVDDDIGESEASLAVTLDNLPAPAVGDLGFAMGNPFGLWFTGDESELDYPQTIDYDGTDPVSATLRALFWKEAGVSSEFYALASQNIALNDSETTDAVVSSWEPITEVGQLAGSIEAPAGVTEVDVASFLNFSDGASIRLQTVPWNSDTKTFTVTAPDVGSQATHSVTALVLDEGYSWAHADGLALTASDGIELKIPLRPRLQGPLDEAENVNEDTVLRWTPSEAGPCSLVILNSHAWYAGLYIVTCEDEVTIGPDILGSLFESGEQIFWSVQSHGAQQNADAMTGSDGFFDPYFNGHDADNYPRGKNRPLKGSFASSEFWSFFPATD